ncbi:E3 ubiquitin-protein ligase SHPRH-like [Glandiceps talaboti]
MPRKRKGVPQRVDEDKRQCLSWNMLEDINATTTQSEETLNHLPQVKPVISLAETIDNSNHPSEIDQSICSIQNVENTISQSEYNNIWEAADYSITVHNSLKVKSCDWSCKLGTFTVQLSQYLANNDKGEEWTAPEQLPNDDKLSLFINKGNNLHHLIYDCYGNNENMSGVTSINMYKCFKIDIKIPKLQYLDDLEILHQYASGRLLRVVKNQYYHVTAEMTFDLYLLKSVLSKLKYPSQPGNPGKRQYSCLQGLMQWFYGIPIYDNHNRELETGRKEPLQDINALFDTVRDCHENEDRISSVNPQHISLLPQLRPYQCHGVRWMLERENYGKKKESVEEQEVQLQVHSLWKEITSEDNKVFYFNIYNGEIVLEKPTQVVQHPGGILADEMGLGKTVEVLACMLLHPRTDLSDNNHKQIEKNEKNYYKNDVDEIDTKVSPGDGNQPGGIDVTMPTDVDLSKNDKDHTDIQGQSSTCQSFKNVFQTFRVGEMECNNENEKSGIISLDNKFTEQQSSNNTTHEMDCDSGKQRGGLGKIPEMGCDSGKQRGGLEKIPEMDCDSGKQRGGLEKIPEMDCDSGKQRGGLGKIPEMDCDSGKQRGGLEKIPEMDCDSGKQRGGLGKISEMDCDSGKQRGGLGKIPEMDCDSGKQRGGLEKIPEMDCDSGKQRGGLEKISELATKQKSYENDGFVPINETESKLRGEPAKEMDVAMENDFQSCESSRVTHSTDIFVTRSKYQPCVYSCNKEQNILQRETQEVFMCAQKEDVCKETGEINTDGSGTPLTNVKSINNSTEELADGRKTNEDVCSQTSKQNEDRLHRDETVHCEDHSQSDAVANYMKEEVSEVKVQSDEMIEKSKKYENSQNCNDKHAHTIAENNQNCNDKHADTIAENNQNFNDKHGDTIAENNQNVDDKHADSTAKNTLNSDGWQKVDEEAFLMETSDGTTKSTDFEHNQQKQTKKKVPYWSRFKAKKKVQFQCICGIKEADEKKDKKLRVKCSQCGLWQHAECVNYDFEHADHIEYHCPHCLVAMPPLPSCATLIISPSSISHQWVDEINRHIKTATLKVLVYQGVKKHGFIQPHSLASHDIVITTYETLRNEINYVDLPHSNSDEGRRFRHAKRYMAVPSSITAVQWWRVCLDEAQMVECATTKAAEMALRLSAVNRWCVTGTPIQKGMEDLYGLFLFLGVDPYWVKYWWNRLLYQPYLNGNPRPVNEAVAKVLWRTAKKDVLDQINIPNQTEVIHWLKFSPVEEHFYHRKHEDCAQNAIRVLNRWPQDPNTKLSQLDRKLVHAMMWPLLKLRQACCHPQAVRGEFLPLHKSTMTMEELLKSLTQKTKLECEESHRQFICALNGLAALHIIREEYVDAVDMYREVLRAVEEHRGQLKTDSLQRLHTLYNLNELLEQSHPGISPTLRDAQLGKEANEIKATYMAKAVALVTQTQQNLRPIQMKITELRKKCQSGCLWWMDTIDWSIQSSEDKELVDKIHDELASKASTNTITIMHRFRNASGLRYVLQNELEKLEDSHSEVLQTLHSLSKEPDMKMLNSAIECHLRPFKGLVKKDCVFCQADAVFSQYETKLFSMQKRNLQELVIEEQDGDTVVMGQGSQTTGTWAAGEVERSLKVILSYAKLRRYSDDDLTVQDGNTQMELFENLRKEFKCLRSVWMSLRDHVAAMDELEMTTMRLRLLLPDEPHDPDSQPYIIEPCRFDQTRLKHISDKIIATSELRKKLGQLLYLTNLAKVQDGCQEGCNPEPCPICAKQLGSQWTVLHCGHCFCNDCMDILIRQYSVGGRSGAIKCAICRQRTPIREISYVSTDPSSHLNEEDKHIKVKGSHSTKVEAVVRTLKKIQSREQGTKALVFSTWQDVLDVIGQALTDNGIEYRYITNAGHRHFQTNLLDFKHDRSVSTLLLPVHCGSHGLNIIEATHVLLVEPIINPASELQAVGRVHRIGQTKPTIVHRFLVGNTIEERMHAMLKPLHSSATLDTTQSDAAILTIKDLRQLFNQEHQQDDSNDSVL